MPAVFAAVLALYRPAFLATLDNAVFDVLVRWAGTRPPGGRVVIVDVDERSLATIGQWPWRRDLIGRLVARLQEMGASAIALDVIFPMLHGPYGEDGTIQGLLELANIPYVGAGVLASAVGMDKAVMKVLFAARGLPVCAYRVVLRHEWEAHAENIGADLEKTLKYPMFVKPANLGSSVGISKAKDPSGLRDAMALAGSFDRKIVVEAAVPDAREIECAVLGNDAPEASVPGEIIPSREFYDYEAKYIDTGSKTVIPADLPKKTAEKVRQMSIDAFKAIDGAGMARVDFLLGRTDQSLYVNEVNTIPGFTTISMFAKLWTASGVNYPALLDRLIALAVERHTERQQLRTSVI